MYQCILGMSKKKCQRKPLYIQKYSSNGERLLSQWYEVLDMPMYVDN